jgi:hypothetical protein
LKAENVCVTVPEPSAVHAEETWFTRMNFDEFREFISDPVGVIKKYNEEVKGRQAPITCIEHRKSAEFAIRFKLLKGADCEKGWSALVQGLTTKCVLNVTVFVTGADLPADITFGQPQTMQIVETGEFGVGCFHYDPDRPIKETANGHKISNDLLAMIWNPSEFAKHLNEQVGAMSGRSRMKVHQPDKSAKRMRRLSDTEANEFLKDFRFVAPLEGDDLQIVYDTGPSNPDGPGCYSCSGQIIAPSESGLPGCEFVLNNIMATSYCP